MLSIAVAESPPHSGQVTALMCDFVTWLRGRTGPRSSVAGTQSRTMALWTLVLSIALAIAASPPEPENLGVTAAGAAQTTETGRRQRQQRLDDIWCNHVITVDSLGFTDKVLDCRTMAAWRVAMQRSSSSSRQLAMAQ